MSGWAGPSTLAGALDALERVAARAGAALEVLPPPTPELALELEALGLPLAGLHAYRWWEPSMRLPALWHWLNPSSSERRDACKVRDRLRLTVSIAVQPAAHTGEDAHALEHYVDAYAEALDAALAAGELGRHPDNRRTGLSFERVTLGDVVALSAEFPLELVYERTIRLTPTPNPEEAPPP